MYTGWVKKVTLFWYLVSLLVKYIIFAIFVYSRVIFIKWMH